MNKLTKEQWELIEQKLSGSFGFVDLMIDGYKITLLLQRVRMRLVIAICVNGKFEMSHNLTEGTDIQRRFWCPRKKYIHSAKYRKSFKRMRKSLRESLEHDANRTWTYYWPWWNSFRSLKAHLIKNNQSIELAEEKKEAESA